MLLLSHTLFDYDSEFTDHNIIEPQRILRELIASDVTFHALRIE